MRPSTIVLLTKNVLWPQHLRHIRRRMPYFRSTVWHDRGARAFASSWCPSPSSSSSPLSTGWAVAGVAAAAAAAVTGATMQGEGETGHGCRNDNGLSGSVSHVAHETGAVLHNYSGMHMATPAVLHSPKSLQELEDLVQACHDRGVALRPVGRFLSPNGIASAGTRDAHMVSLADMDRVINVDVEKRLVKVEGGALVGDVVEALKPYGLTLSNFSSISEQRMAGWIQVAAHGTGATLATVDEMVTDMTLVTPHLGTLRLSRNSSTDALFRMAVVGLGSLGIVANMTLKCVPAHTLQETVSVTSTSTVAHRHAHRLRSHRHVRYHYIPHTDDVVIAVCDPVGDNAISIAPDTATTDVTATDMEPTYPLRQLLANERARRGMPTPDDMDTMSFAALRDALLDMDPFSSAHVRQVNEAEAQFWRAASGSRTGPSPDILGFDCGGQQLVLEVCMPAGTTKYPNGAGIQFVKDLCAAIRAHDLPVPAPIEQRWSARSRAFMSPAYSEDPSQLFTWVGVITYLPPSHGDANRRRLLQQFQRLVGHVNTLCQKYNAVPHWAKIEMPADADADTAGSTPSAVSTLRNRLRSRYPLPAFRTAQQALDPKGILTADNPVIQRLLLQEDGDRTPAM